ncbi:putative DNA-binding transcriptional regulator YafY [Evansella vedderi]|uniref:DNA-binding transcriptional regulator YafY n=1 Tax=Evansella vedderi TaxID=38282 RepID=A0ABT9ZRQ3_9BACI|nr:WYL domain-containing protein [Evansella vedderi]MDQ0253421.1 putative DNA-binding transcriptional regulator YafY [Evansella vedderi]
MEKKLNNKQRLLRVQDLLKKYTDEDTELSLEELLDKFYEENGVHIGRKALRDDLRELEESRLFDVTENQEKEGVEKYYSHQHRLFEIHELRLLVDAVSSAKFITKKETEKLVTKIQALTSKNLAKQLENRIILSDSAKTENDKVKHIIHELHTAIQKQQEITFQYGKYNLAKQFVLNRDGAFYNVKPYALVWNNDFYYLIGEYIPRKEIRHYRVDRMRNISSTEGTFLPDPNFDTTKYTQKLFHMYAGEESILEIEFAADLINVVIDRFGREASIRPTEEGTFRLSTTAVISDGLVRWLLTWGCDAKVLTPPFLVERMKEESEKLYNRYHS